MTKERNCFVTVLYRTNKRTGKDWGQLERTLEGSVCLEFGCIPLTADEPLKTEPEALTLLVPKSATGHDRDSVTSSSRITAYFLGSGLILFSPYLLEFSK